MADRWTKQAVHLRWTTVDKTGCPPDLSAFPSMTYGNRPQVDSGPLRKAPPVVHLKPLGTHDLHKVDKVAPLQGEKKLSTSGWHSVFPPTCIGARRTCPALEVARLLQTQIDAAQDAGRHDDAQRFLGALLALRRAEARALELLGAGEVTP